MLEKINHSVKVEDKKIIKEEIKNLEVRLEKIQRTCKEKGIPILILMEGFTAAGKGTLTNRMIHPWDPRGFFVETFKDASEEENRYPFLWRFWQKLPAEGQIAVYHRGWYREVISRSFGKKNVDIQSYVDEINNFEKTLTDNGTVVVKFFACITKKEQKKRFDYLLSDKKTAWRISADDKKQNKKYDDYYEFCDRLIEKTNTVRAPWYILDTSNSDTAVLDMMKQLVNRLERELNRDKYMTSETLAVVIEEPLSEVTLKGKELSREEYKEKLKKLQKKISTLHNELYEKKIPVIFAFEGWDAGGKGGAIKRLTEYMDPRGYIVHPVAAPTKDEKAHHHLWKFWKKIPKSGHIAVFDRTWYGRVMVERLEGFCSEEDWKRGYREINQFEKTLTDAGAVVVKFWLQIDKDEQLSRFTARQENPEKQWKITDEDWRNRDKWDLYEVAVNEMIARTDKPNAPWVIVEGNDKYYARIKVLETAVAAMESALAQKK